MQHSLVDAALLTRVLLSSVRNSVAEWGAALPSGQIYAPGGLSVGLKEDILFLEIVYIIFLGEQRSCYGGGGRAAPRLAW